MSATQSQRWSRTQFVSRLGEPPANRHPQRRLVVDERDNLPAPQLAGEGFHSAQHSEQLIQTDLCLATQELPSNRPGHTAFAEEAFA